MSRFRPTLMKSIVPAGLLALSLLPDALVRQGIFGTLSYPLSFIYHGVPFVYADKPGYITPLGAAVTAAVWAAIIYGATCCMVPRGAGTDAKA